MEIDYRLNGDGVDDRAREHEASCREQCSCPKSWSARGWLALRIGTFILMSALSGIGYFANRALISDLQSRMSSANPEAMLVGQHLLTINSTMQDFGARIDHVFQSVNALESNLSLSLIQLQNIQQITSLTEHSVRNLSAKIEQLNITQLILQVDTLRTLVAATSHTLTALNQSLSASTTNAISTVNSASAALYQANNTVWRDLTSWSVAFQNATETVVGAVEARTRGLYSVHLAISASSCAAIAPVPATGWVPGCVFNDIGDYTLTINPNVFRSYVNAVITAEHSVVTGCHVVPYISTTAIRVQCPGGTNADVFLILYGL